MPMLGFAKTWPDFHCGHAHVLALGCKRQEIIESKRHMAACQASAALHTLLLDSSYKQFYKASLKIS